MDKIKGVNLGNWLVLEPWMSPALFEDLQFKDEMSMYEQLSIEDVKIRLKVHRDSYITERDFRKIKDFGLNLVRLPIPYTLFGDFPPYLGCIDYVDKAFEWANKYGIKIMLDLHTCPGGQNGFDNSGLTGVCKWHLEQKNIDDTVDIIKRLSVRYGHNKALYGIEVLNEPINEVMWAIISKHIKPFNNDVAKGSSYVPTEVLKRYYLECYSIIREYCDDNVYVILHDGFRLREWADFMVEPEYKNVIIDAHLYLNFAHLETLKDLSLEGYMGYLKDVFEVELKEAIKHHNIVVGEWSLGNKITNSCEEERIKNLNIFFDEQTKVWDKCNGWVFWSYKLNVDNRLEWDYDCLNSSGIAKRYN